MASAAFSTSVDAWAAETKERLTAIFRESVERVISEMQTPAAFGGNLPVDTGFLRASLQVSTAGPIGAGSAAPIQRLDQISREIKRELGGQGDDGRRSDLQGLAKTVADRRREFTSYNPMSIALTIKGADLGDTVWVGYGAAYATFVHFGANGRPGRQWVTLAAQRWPQIVAQVSAEAKTRSRPS